MDHKELLEQIDVWHDEGDHQEIVDAILALPVKDRDYELIGQLAVAYNNTEKYNEAIQTLLDTAKEGKNHHKWYYRLGYAYSALEKYEEAISNFTEAIKLDPEDSTYYECRGLAYNELEKYEEAIHDFTEAIKLDPEDGFAYYNRGCTYSELGREKEAELDFNKVRELDPEGSEDQEDRDGTGSFISFVLLDENKIDLDLLRKQLQKDWGIIINKKPEDDPESLIETIDDMALIVSLMPAPIPNDEAVDNARTNFYWEDAVEVAKSHKAYMTVAVLGGEKKLLDATDLFVKVCSSCLKQPNAIAISTLGSVLQPKFYIDSAESSLNDNEFPLMNMVFFGMYSNDNGATLSLYTYGLDVYGKLNMEIIDSDKSEDETLSLLQSITEYVITSDVTLQDGETIGFSEEQKLKITALDSTILGKETLKIDF